MQHVTVVLSCVIYVWSTNTPSLVAYYQSNSQLWQPILCGRAVPTTSVRLSIFTLSGDYYNNAFYFSSPIPTLFTDISVV